MVEKKFSLLRSLLACFLAIEAGALVVCIGLMILEGGLLASFEGIATWVVGQLIILPIALISMPFGALLRMILGLVFDKPRIVAVAAGATIGLIGSLLLVNSATDKWIVWLQAGSLGLVAGAFGGWVWWRIEKPLLGRQEDQDTV